MTPATLAARRRLVVPAIAVVLFPVACQGTGSPNHAATANRPTAVIVEETIGLPGNAYPSAMALAPDGALWVTEESIGAIARIDTGGHVTQYRIPGESNDPDGILRGPDGQMWFVGSELIGRVDVSGRMTGWQDGAGANVGLPNAITLGPDGSVWYTNGNGPNSTIGRVGPGQAPAVVGTVPNAAIFPARGLTTGPDQAVWFSEVAQRYGPDAIGRVDEEGQYSAWPLPPASIPQGLVTGPDGAIWFTERTGIGRITTAGAITQFPIPGGQRPTDIIAGPEAALWFTTATRLWRITTAGRVTSWPVPDATSLDAIVAAGNDKLWLADTKANDVLRIRAPG